jgi:hypothetical protein
LSLAAALALYLQTGSIPWIPPLRSRSIIEVQLHEASGDAVLARLAAECRSREMGDVVRNPEVLTCEVEPDDTSRLAYMAMTPAPVGPLRGFVRFSLVHGSTGPSLQAQRFAQYRVRGAVRQVVSDDLAIARDILSSSGLVEG